MLDSLVKYGCTSSSLPNTTIIPPPGGSACINRPLAAIKRKLSSKLITPATQAATYSPTLCPINTVGFIPQENHNCVNAYSNANKPGWVYRVSFNNSLALPHKIAGNV